jgi:hypothetical protein
MNLVLLPETFTVCQMPPDAAIPAWATGPAPFLSITRTADELSIACLAHLVPAAVKQESNWRAFKVEGPLDFALTGILASLAAPLAQARVSIFAVATYDTDYLLVRSDQVAAAGETLRAAGFTVRAG